MKNKSKKTKSRIVDVRTSDSEEVNSCNTGTVKLENSTVNPKAMLYTATLTFKDFTCC